MRKDVNWDFFFALIIAAVMCVMGFLVIFIFGRIASYISDLYKKKVYNKLFQMHIGWFDDKEHTPAKLGNIMFSDIMEVNNFVDLILSFYIQFFVGIVLGLVMSFVTSWKMSLALIVLVVIIFICGWIDSKFTQSSVMDEDKYLKASLEIMSETVKNYRTILSFGSEQKVLQLYNKSLEDAKRQDMKRGVLSSFLYALSQLA